MSSDPSAELRQIPLGSLAPGPWHVRDYSEDDVTELAASLASPTGQIEPIVVRPDPSAEGYEIIAGVRRLRAAHQAGLPSLAAIVREVDDAEAAAICWEENAKRRDLTVQEEAMAVDKVVAAAGGVARASEVLGRPHSWVEARSYVVHRLSETWWKAVEGPASRWTLSHLAAVARLPEADQDALLAVFRYRSWALTVPQLLAVIERTVARRVAAAPWDTSAFQGGLPNAPACLTCPQRSSMSLLFEEMTLEDRCLNPECWRARERAYGLDAIAQARAERPDAVVLIDHSSPEWVPSEGLAPRVVASASRVPETPEIEGAVPAIVVEPSGRVREGWVRPEESIPAEERLTKQDRLYRKRVKVQCQLLSAEIAAMEKWPPALSRMLLVDMVAVFGTAERRERPELGTRSTPLEEEEGVVDISLVSAWSLIDNKGVEDRLWSAVRPVLLARLSWERWSSAPGLLAAECREVSRALKLDLEAIRRRVEAEVPIPLSWTAEESAEFDW